MDLLIEQIRLAGDDAESELFAAAKTIAEKYRNGNIIKLLETRGATIHTSIVAAATTPRDHIMVEIVDPHVIFSIAGGFLAKTVDILRQHITTSAYQIIPTYVPQELTIVCPIAREDELVLLLREDGRIYSTIRRSDVEVEFTIGQKCANEGEMMSSFHRLCDSFAARSDIWRFIYPLMPVKVAEHLRIAKKTLIASV